MESIYTSTGLKYTRHPIMIEALRSGYARPQSLQISLTNRCNLNCNFCSVSKRNKKEEWEPEILKDAIFQFVKAGIGTVELTGAGEPTLYQGFSDIVTFCRKFDLKLGLITNGTLLKNIPRGTLEELSWIRISMTSLDYVDEIEIPQLIMPTIGFSYIVGTDNKKELAVLDKIKKYVDQYKPRYVRVVPECFKNELEMQKIHEEWDAIISHQFGPPFFFQHKNQGQAAYCYIDAVKPWLHTDGYVYPCNSISLHTNAGRDFRSEYRLCHWTKATDYYRNRGNGSIPWVQERCDRCTFRSNNYILHQLVNPIIHEEFV